jgi:sulfur-carrier protein
MTRVTVLYFAGLRERAGRDQEVVETGAADLAALYAELDARHALGWPPDRLRVAMNGEFAQWGDPLRDAAEVVFVPPVSGG